MERKISAHLELQENEEHDIKKENLPAGEALTFSPCNVISCFYEYPVYCCENGLDSQHHTTYFISENSLLCVLPDPLVCFAKASYVQTETFHLESSSNLVVLNWYTSGRYARGEQWDFSKLKSVSSIYINGKLKFKEALNMRSVPTLSIKTAMKSYNIFGTCFVIGSYLNTMSRNLLEDLGKYSGYGEKRDPSTIFAISPLYIDDNILTGCLIRFVSESVENTMKRIETMLEPLYSTLGGNPFENK
ncbi:uncharacterized protein LOC129229863 isoform X2 [Uloborus diversus]|uniref:uncharacterized protein LOC129229863 isoform X2 n=1 Tax=Uloborus diversus TaxID=327109 RepID=UPI002409406D|nr:uncharacterized protein LOC129229863 isoform X2 [Uloborus diversus]